MGLFGFGKKRQSPVRNESKKIESPNLFYTTCVKDFHEAAKQQGQAMRDVIFIPELMEYGTNALLWFYRNEGIQQQIPDPASYYFVAVSTALRCGILFACQWHENYNAMKAPGYVERIMENGPSTYTPGIIQRNLHLTEKEFGSFAFCILERWMECHKPYWELRDARDYTFQATMAAYQLGISMMLCKLGY